MSHRGSAGSFTGSSVAQLEKQVAVPVGLPRVAPGCPGLPAVGGIPAGCCQGLARGGILFEFAAGNRFWGFNLGI
jgi:hypothetical protein